MTLKSFFTKHWSNNKAHNNYHVEWMKGIGGFILIIFSLAKLSWNEKEAIYFERCYQEALESKVLPTSDAVLPENNGRVVKVTGQLRIPKALSKHPYGISINAVKLKLRVQMYQWIEEKIIHVDDFDDASFQYKMVWKDKLINSSTFYESNTHINPASFPIKSQVIVNPEVFLGSFLLTDEVKYKFRDFTEFTSSQRPQGPEIKMYMGLYYHSVDVWKPSIGDLRVQFSYAGGDDTIVSVIAQQVGQELRTFRSLKGNSTAYLQQGYKSNEDMLDVELSAKIYVIWQTRFLTWILTFLGILLMSSVLKSQDHVIVVPLFGIMPFEFEIILSLGPWLATFGLLWLAIRPDLGIPVLIASAVVLCYTTTMCNLVKL